MRSQPAGEPFKHGKIFTATLALSGNAQASIFHSGPINNKVQAGGGHQTQIMTFQVDAHDLEEKVANGGTSSSANLIFKGPGLAPKFAGNANQSAKRYVAAAPINFAGGQQLGVLCFHSSSSQGGFWGPGTVNSFVGFHDTAGHQGWIQENLGYASDTVTGKTILAGNTGIAAAPEPGTAGLSVLALGASGILARAAAATKQSPSHKRDSPA